MPVRLWTLEEAAAFLNMEQKELRQLAVSGEVPAIEHAGKWLFEHDELDAWYTTKLLRRESLRHVAPRRGQEALDRFSLVDFCCLEGMEPSLRAKTKTAVLAALTEVAERTGKLYDPQEFLEKIRRREESASTAMREGAALVHPEGIDEYLCEGPFLAVAKAATPVFFGEPNGVPTEFFFVIASPDPVEHLHILAEICRRIADEDLLEKLREAQSPEEMLAALE